MEYYEFLSEDNDLFQFLDNYTRIDVIPAKCVIVEDLTKLKSGADVFYQVKSDPPIFRKMIFYEYESKKHILRTIVHAKDKYYQISASMESIENIWALPVIKKESFKNLAVCVCS